MTAYYTQSHKPKLNYNKGRDRMETKGRGSVYERAGFQDNS